MAFFRFNATRGLARMANLEQELRLGAERINRREARVLQRAMKRVSPVHTGRMRRNIKVRKSRRLGKRITQRRRGFGQRRSLWQVYIPRHPFPRFWYPILYLSDMYKKVSPLRTPTRRRLFDFVRRIFRRA
jgi:hypothetical protein